MILNFFAPPSTRNLCNAPEDGHMIYWLLSSDFVVGGSTALDIRLVLCLVFYEGIWVFGTGCAWPCRDGNRIITHVLTGKGQRVMLSPPWL